MVFLSLTVSLPTTSWTIWFFKPLLVSLGGSKNQGSGVYYWVVNFLALGTIQLFGFSLFWKYWLQKNEGPLIWSWVTKKSRILFWYVILFSWNLSSEPNRLSAEASWWPETPIFLPCCSMYITSSYQGPVEIYNLQ